MNAVFKVLLLTAIIAVSQFLPVIEYNEMDAIPYGYALFNSSWLSNDWYLSQQISYRLPFGYVSGFFVHHFGFVPTIFFGRIFSYLLFSYAYHSLLRAAKTNFALGSIGLMLFFLFFPKGMYAGEWMIGGLETKVFAYSFALLALSASLKRNLGLVFLFSGISFSLHLLIGGYHLICVTAIIVYQIVNQDISFKATIKKSYGFLVGGFWGIVSVYAHFVDQMSAELSHGWDIYVQVRVPFHVLPKLYFEALLLPFLFSIFNVFMLVLTKNSLVRSLLFYVLSATAISGIGIFIYLFGDQSLLRYYFFRFSDVIQPFLSILIVGILLTERLTNLEFPKLQRAMRIALPIILFFSFTLFCIKNPENLKPFFNGDSYSSKAIISRSSKDLEMADWIKKNTSTTSVFVAPMGMETFYIDAERSLFVSWKHSPQRPSEMIEWYKRILLLNKGEDLFAKNIDPKREVEKSYSRLSENEILEIGRLYPEITHIIFPAANELAFDEVHRTERFILYRL